MSSFDMVALFQPPTDVRSPPQPPSEPTERLPRPSTLTKQTSLLFRDTSTTDWPTLTPAPPAPAPVPGTSSPFPVTRGRKRSRDDSDFTTDDGSVTPSTLPPTPAPEPEIIYGEGMTLIRPNGFIVQPASQSGTWVEEAASAQPPPSPPTNIITTIEIPRLLSRKSQRLDTSSIFANGLPDTSPTSSSPFQSAEPQIDYSTILLGVGWTSIATSSTDNESDVAAAVRGWTKFIANHYPITIPRILLRSAGLSAFLVHAEEGFFLFNEDLGQGQLVGRTEEEALYNLKSGAVNCVEESAVLRATGLSKTAQPSNESYDHKELLSAGGVGMDLD